MEERMETDKITDAKLYELILTIKCHEEKQRDEINKYYTSLFTGIVAVMPLIEKFTSIKDTRIIESGQPLKFLLLSLSMIGVLVSISWILSLKRIYNYINGFDELLVKLEKKHNQQFITYMNQHMHNVHSPGRVTKQLMLLPTAFLIIFSIIFLYNLGYLKWIVNVLTFPLKP
jgi:hypothetical protein